MQGEDASLWLNFWQEPGIKGFRLIFDHDDQNCIDFIQQSVIGCDGNIKLGKCKFLLAPHPTITILQNASSCINCKKVTAALFVAVAICGVNSGWGCIMHLCDWIFSRIRPPKDSGCFLVFWGQNCHDIIKQSDIGCDGNTKPGKCKLQVTPTPLTLLFFVPQESHDFPIICLYFSRKSHI